MPVIRQRSTQIVFTILLCLGLLFYSIASSAAPRLPSPKRECSTCHIMWLNEFKRKDVTTLIPYDPQPVVDSGKQDVVSTERMCFSCHDGYVMDSRFLWKNRKHTHPVGVEPSAKVNIPLIEDKLAFPLNEDGKVYCGTCHSAHGVDWNQKESPIFLRVKNINSSMCLFCHKNRSTGPAKGNHPILKKPPKNPDNLLNVGAMLSTEGEVVCQTCHRVHGAPEKKLLVWPNHESKLCTSCHDKKQSILETKHDMRFMAPDEKNIKGRTVGQSGPCSACHIPHGASGRRLWSRYIMHDTDVVSSFCLGCHSDKGPAHEKTLGTYTHPVNVPVSNIGIRASVNKWASKFAMLPDLAPIQQLPLFNKTGETVKKGGNITCLTCHEPHQWSPTKKSAKKADPREIEGDGNNSFLRIPHNGKNRLCTNCHRDKATVMLSKHDLSISAANEKNVADQTVAQNGACSACHLPHNGEGAKMWAKETSRAWEGVERLCVSCHRDTGVAEKKQTGEATHPIHVGLDKLPLKAKPELPLYTWEATRDDKHGEVDCATCHDPHQWQPGKPTTRNGANADAEGHTESSFLRVQASQKAELCILCHRDKATLLGTDHDLTVTAPKAQNAKGQTLAEAGICGQCHSVHKPVLPQRLWSRQPGPGEDVMESMCRGCHRQNDIAELKIPPKTAHPKRKVPSNKGRLIGMRTKNISPSVFGADGKVEMAGFITCPTCHNPHQWDPKIAKAGKGKNLEGDAMTSFLRHKNTEYFLCSDCHGEDSLFRYKYFHWEKSRTKHHLYKP